MSLKTRFGKSGLEAAGKVPARAKAKSVKMKSARGGAKAGAKAGRRAVASNAYVYALMHDDTLKRQLDDAYSSLVKAYDRISSQDDLANSLLEDQRTRRHLSRATTSLRGAADTLRHAKGPRRRRGVRLMVLVGLAGGMAAVAFNEDLRNKLIGSSSSDESVPATSASGGNGVVPSAAVENAPPTTTAS